MPSPPETDLAISDPAPAAETAQPPLVSPPSPATSLPVTLDVIRVERNGQAVIAGQAAPGALVELLDAGEPVARARANERGEWVLALDRPLVPGPHDLAVRTTSVDKTTVTLSDRRLAVDVPADGSDVLVVLNAPGAPSRILQLPERSAEVAEPETAAISEDGAPSLKEEIAPAVSLAAPAAKPAPASPAGQAPSGTASVLYTSPVMVPAPAPAPAVGSEPGEEVVALAAPSVGLVNEKPAASAEAEIVAEPHFEGTGKAADDEAAAIRSAAGAVEIKSAGSAKGGVGEDEGGGVPETAGTVESESVAAASVPIPAVEAAPEVATSGLQATVAEQPAEPTGKPATDPAITSSLAPAPPDESASHDAVVAEAATGVMESPAKPETAPRAVMPQVALTAVEADTSGSFFIAGVAETPEPVRVYLDGIMIGEAKPWPSGTWLLEIRREMPPGTYAVRADQVDASGNVIVRAEVSFERELDVAILRPIATPGSAAGAAAAGAIADPETIIIKRRDNLWRISRRMYGKGVRWSSIYQANRDQIRNPRWIYPGQVFVVPSGDLSWKE